MENISNLRFPYVCAIFEILLVVSFVSLTAFAGIPRPVIFANVFYFSAISTGLNFASGQSRYEKNDKDGNVKNKLLDGFITPFFALLSTMLTIGTGSTACHFAINTNTTQLTQGNLTLTNGLIRDVLVAETESVDWFKAQGGIFCFISAWNVLTLIAVTYEIYQLKHEEGPLSFMASRWYKVVDERVRSGTITKRNSRLRTTRTRCVTIAIFMCILIMMICIIIEVVISLLCLIFHLPLMSDMESPNYLSIVLSVVLINKMFHAKRLFKMDIWSLSCWFYWATRLYSIILSTFSLSALTDAGYANGVHLLNPLYVKSDLSIAFSTNLGGYRFTELEGSTFYQGLFVSFNMISYIVYLTSLILSYLLFVLGFIDGCNYYRSRSSKKDDENKRAIVNSSEL